MRVEQRSAGVSRIDGRVCLNCALDGPPISSSYWTLQATDDAGGKCPIKTEGIADRQHLLTNLKLLRITQRNNRQRLLWSFNQLDYGQVGVWIAAHQPGRVVLLSTETDGEFRGALDDVVIRKDVAFLVYH